MCNSLFFHTATSATAIDMCALELVTERNTSRDSIGRLISGFFLTWCCVQGNKKLMVMEAAGNWPGKAICWSLELRVRG